MLNQQDHLALRLMRLKSPEELEQKGEWVTFVFSKSGSGKYTSKTATQRLSPGDILLVNSAGGGKLAVAESKPEFAFWIFSACFENLLPLFGSHEISLLHALTETLKTPKIYAANSPLAQECQRLLSAIPAEFDLDHRGQVIRIAASILSVEFKAAQTQRGGYARAEDHMARVFEKLTATEIINLSVGELADKFSCSRRHLNRLFHQHFGVSVAALRMETRLLKAVSLLRDANAKIINVAEECGFNHLGLFNTCFKRRFGASPGQWRKSALQAESVTAKKPEKKNECPLHSTGLCPMSNRAAAPVMATASSAEKTKAGTKYTANLAAPTANSLRSGRDIAAESA
jgi:AraC-like DNA-binding protein